MEPILAVLEVESHFGKPVRVEFTKIDGVISHTIVLVNGSEKVPVLTSRINVPGHPCFTELHQQDDLLFLTGADGPCHWSMSVQKRHMTFAGVTSPTEETLNLLEKRFGLNAPGDLSSGSHSFGQVLFFDIACRLKEPVSGLCSPYITRDSFEGSETICACCVMDRSDASRGMVLLGGPTDERRHSDGPDYSMVCITEREISLMPVNTHAASFPTTLRWSYAVWRMM